MAQMSPWLSERTRQTATILAVLAELDAPVRLSRGTSPRRKPRRTMSRRCGQSGGLILRNGRWIGRFYVDGPERRTRKAVVIGEKSGMTRAEAKRKLMQLIADQGINKPEHLTNALHKVTGTTFNSAADKWEQIRLSKLGQSSQYAVPKLINKHLRPFFGAMAIDAVKTGTVNEWIATQMVGLAPKTVQNMYKLFRAIVNWHYRQEDQQARKWSPDLPPLHDTEQR